MMKNKFVAVSLVLILFSVAQMSLAQKALPSSLMAEVLYVDNRIVTLSKMDDKELANSALQIQVLSAKLATYNAAEQRLLLQLTAKLAMQKNDFSNALSMMKSAYLLDNKIVEQQLFQPIFAQGHLQMAEIYAELGEFDNAFLEKRAYLKKHNAFTTDKEQKTVSALDKKYETQTKIKTNQLLASQNKLRQLQLQKVSQENMSQRTNIFLILLVLIVFIFLFYRQLQTRKKLQLITQTDSLTKLLNRQALFEQGQAFIEDDGHSQLSVVLLDIDFFKKINDDYGHIVGDKVLKQLAILGGEAMRSRDIFARLGGEEFVAVLPEISPDEAKAIAERLKEKVSSFDFSPLGIKRPVTFSLGLVSLSENLADIDFEMLLHYADVAMYKAKASGRNQVVVFDDIDSADSSA